MLKEKPVVLGENFTFFLPYLRKGIFNKRSSWYIRIVSFYIDSLIVYSLYSLSIIVSLFLSRILFNSYDGVYNNKFLTKSFYCKLLVHSLVIVN